MATNKTLAPTGVTVQIPAMSDPPSMAVPANAIDKTIDAVNALNSQLANRSKRVNNSWGASLTWTFTTNPVSRLYVNDTMMAIIWTPSTADISVLVIGIGGTFRKAGNNGSVTFGYLETGTEITCTRDGKTLTLTRNSNASMVVEYD